MKKGIILIYKDMSEDWLELLVAAGFDTVGIHTLYQYGGVQGMLDWLALDKTQVLLEKFRERGISIEYQIHAVDWLLPRAFFAQHPEWFRADPQGNRVGDWNLCVSSREALAYLEEASYNLATKLKQSSHKYYIWPDDCLNSICHCASCGRLSGADQSMIITNTVLKGVKRYDPMAELSFLAYQDALTLPRIKPDPGVFLEFAPIDRNHHAPISGEDPANVKTREMFQKLLTVFPAESAEILEYFLDVSLFCKWKKEDAGALNLDKERLATDFKWYIDQNVAGITTFAGFIDRQWRDRYGDHDIILYGKTLKESL